MELVYGMSFVESDDFRLVFSTSINPNLRLSGSSINKNYYGILFKILINDWWYFTFNRAYWKERGYLCFYAQFKIDKDGLFFLTPGYTYDKIRLLNLGGYIVVPIYSIIPKIYLRELIGIDISPDEDSQKPFNFVDAIKKIADPEEFIMLLDEYDEFFDPNYIYVKTIKNRDRNVTVSLNWIMLAIDHFNSPEIVMLLINKGVDYRYNNGFSTCLYHLIKHRFCDDHWKEFCCLDHDYSFQDERGNTVLMEALNRGYYCVLDTSFERINDNSIYNLKDECGRDLIYFCSRYPPYKYARILLDKGVNFNNVYKIPEYFQDDKSYLFQNTSETVLLNFILSLWRYRSSDPQVVHLTHVLLKKGYRVVDRDADGTAIFYALWDNMLFLAIFLLRNGCRYNPRLDMHSDNISSNYSRCLLEAIWIPLHTQHIPNNTAISRVLSSYDLIQHLARY